MRFTFDPITIRLPAYFRDSANILLFPNFTISEPYPSLGGGGYHNQPRDTHGIQNNIVYQRGRHNRKSGAEYRLLRFHPFQVRNPTGGFSFSPDYTPSGQKGAASPTQGSGLASLLLGVGDSTSIKRPVRSILR